MTALIGISSEDSDPLLFGDLLIANQTRDDLVNRLPTFRDVPGLFPAKASYFPCGMHQKVAVIGGKLAVGWAGNLECARDFLSHLYTAAENGDLDYDYVKWCFNSVHDEDTQFIGLVLTDRGTYQHFGTTGCNVRQMPSLGTVSTLGTGAAAIEYALRVFTHSYTPRKASPEDFIPLHARKTLNLVTSLSGLLLTSEIRNGKTIQRAFGGGYEAAVLSRDKFVKMDRFTHAFWTVCKGSEGNITIWLYHTCSYAYSGDILVVRTLSRQDTADGIFFHHWYDYVDPVYRYVTKEEHDNAKVPEWNTSRFMFHHVLIQGVPGDQNIFFMWDYRSKPETHRVTFMESPESGRRVLRCRMEGSFIKQLAEMVNIAMSDCEKPGYVDNVNDE